MLVQLFLLSFSFIGIQATTALTRLLVTRVGPCSYPQKNAVKVSEFDVITKDFISDLSGVIIVSEDLSNNWKIKATMQKCVDIRNIDTCDSFKTFYLVKDGCSAEDEERDLYGMFFNYAIPKIKCPVKAGRYEIIHYPFYTEVNYESVHQSKISTSVFGYTFKLDGITLNDTLIFCVEASLQLLYQRDHDWLKIDRMDEGNVSNTTLKSETNNDGD